MAHSKRAFTRFTVDDTGDRPGSHTVDTLTLAYYDHVNDVLRVVTNDDRAHATITQGCYTTSFPGSGNTHGGSGALDRQPVFASHSELEWTSRICGGASWHRPRNWDGKGGIEHNHTIVIGDEKASQEALSQVHDYFAGLNGLANHGPDTGARPNPILPFAFPLGRVSLANVREQATVGPRKKQALVGVKNVQKALNLKRGTSLVVDGIWGPATHRAYKRWEIQVGGNADGIPARRGLTLLGASRFTVVD